MLASAVASDPSGACADSPLHERHVALGAKLADFGGWEMPIEYPGGGVSRSTPRCARPSASSTSATSARPSVRGPGRGGVRQRDA